MIDSDDPALTRTIVHTRAGRQYFPVAVPFFVASASA